jgi:hypothetical protein
MAHFLLKYLFGTPLHLNQTVFKKEFPYDEHGWTQRKENFRKP